MQSTKDRRLLRCTIFSQNVPYTHSRDFALQETIWHTATARVQFKVPNIRPGITITYYSNRGWRSQVPGNRGSTARTTPATRPIGQKGDRSAASTHQDLTEFR